MDSYRSQRGVLDLSADAHVLYQPVLAGLDEGSLANLDDEQVDEAPPPQIGTDERRMQVRAYNFWASLLADRTFPPITALRPETLDDFGPYSVLLDFTASTENPEIAFLGQALASECHEAGTIVRRLSDVPPRSLLSRITDHYLQIIANRAPIGFEAEFVNQRGATILYRGILLPFSSNDEVIDFIYGVINWKELADQQTADELLLEMDQALASPLLSPPRRAEPQPFAEWADGPRNWADDAIEDADFVDAAAETAAPVAQPPATTHTIALADWLAAAREQVAAFCAREERTRNALYEAIGRAWDFALAAAEAPQEFAALLADAGLTMQQRAPMTPVVKLVFGAGYDKTRLTEYAAALAHARRLGLGQGELAPYLRRIEGGLKAVVAAERRMRRAQADTPKRRAPGQPRPALARQLRTLEPRRLDSLPAMGAEFALVLIRRTGTGTATLLGEVPEDAALIERAARRLLG